MLVIELAPYTVVGIPTYTIRALHNVHHNPMLTHIQTGPGVILGYKGELPAPGLREGIQHLRTQRNILYARQRLDSDSHGSVRFFQGVFATTVLAV